MNDTDVLKRSVLFRLTCTLIAVCSTNTLFAQNVTTASFRESVTLETDSSVVKKLSSVKDYVAEQQWDQVVDILQEISDAHGEKLIAISPGRYVNVSFYCNLVFASLPPEGLKSYRERYDPRARQWYEFAKQSRQAQAFIEITERAFVSSYGDDAIWNLAELAWDEGNYSVARTWWRMLLPYPEPIIPGEPLLVLRYPKTDFLPAEIRARLILCSLFEGNAPRAKWEMETFRELHTNQMGTIAGRSGQLAELLEQIAKESIDWNRDTHSDATATFGIKPTRNGVHTHAPAIGALAWSVPLENVNFSRPRLRPGFVEPEPLGHFPVVMDDMVLVNGPYSISAYNLYTGKPYWPIDLEGAANDERAAVIFPTVEIAPSPASRRSVGVPRYTLSAHEGRLYARFGVPITGKTERDESLINTELVGLDLQEGEGKLIWRVTDKQHNQHAAWAFEGTPLVNHGRAYVALRKSRPQTQLNVVCYDTETAEEIWNQKICSAVGAADVDHSIVGHQLLTLADGTLYYSTDIGAIAALNANDGTLKWVVTYPSQIPNDVANFSDPLQHGLKPCLYHRGRIIAAPNDSRDVFSISAATGLVEWQQELPDHIRHVLGVSDGRLFLSGNSLWALDVESGRVVWSYRVQDPAQFGYGRGVLAEDLVFWPTREELIVFHQETGTLAREPINWRARGSVGGHLTIAKGHLLVAEPNRLAVFCDHAREIKRAKKDLTEAKPSPSKLLHLARLLSANQNTEQAAEKYRQALQQIPLKQDRRSQRTHSTISEEFSRFLSRLGQASLAAREFSTAESQLQEALTFAVGKKRQLDILLQLAELHLAANSQANAIQIFQNIIEDESLAQQPAPENSSLTMASSAQRRISRLIAQHGASLYAPWEARAKRSAQLAIEKRDSKALSSIRERFPNSSHTDVWATQLIHWELEQADCLQAARNIRKLLHSSSRTPAVHMAALHAIAKILQERNLTSFARTRWQQLLEKYDSKQIVLDGNKTHIGDYVREHLSSLQASFAANVENFASFGLPFERTWKRTIRNRAPPVFPEGHPPSPLLASVLLNEEKLHCIDRLQGQTRWSLRLSAPAIWATYCETHLVVATAREIVGVSYDAGRPIWWQRFADNEITPTTRFAHRDPLLIHTVASSGICGRNVDDGEIVWAFPVTNSSAHLLQSPFDWQIGEQWIVGQNVDRKRIQILSLDTGSLSASLFENGSPWAEPPVFLGTNRIATVDIDFRIASHHLKNPAGTWASPQPISHAHTSPYLFANESSLFLVAEGDTLSRLTVEEGEKLWSAGLGAKPIISPREAICLTEDAIYAISGGILRAFHTKDGHRLWEQYLGTPTSRWKLIAAGQIVAALRISDGKRSASPTEPSQSIVCCHTQSGRYLQKLHFTREQQLEAIKLHDGPPIVVLNNELIGFRAMPALAAKRQN